MKGPSEKGDQFAVLEYMKAGQVVTHPCAPLQKIEFFIRSPSPSPDQPHHHHHHPNCTPYIQACDKKMVNGAFKSSLEESYAEWVEDKLMGKKRKRGPVPVPSREETATWVLEAFNAITENDIKAACRAAYFPKGMKLSELEDLTYCGNSDSDSSCNSDSDSGTIALKSPLLRMMILVTPMMLPLKLFGLRLPEVCGEWPMSLMGSCTLQETTCKAISFPRI